MGLLLNWLRAFSYVRLANNYYKYFLYLNRRLTTQLAWKTQPPTLVSKSTSVRCLIPLLETSHYQHFQVLILAKALILRGIDVRVLICDQFLDGCELKSSRNTHTDECTDCRFNQQYLLKYFNLPTLKMSEVLTQSQIKELEHLADTVNLSFDDNAFERHGINLQSCVQDSLVRYYYGDVPDANTSLLQIRRDHIKTALISLEVALKLDRQWKPDLVINNMACYSAWEPFFLFYRAKNIFRQISLSQLNFNSIVFNSYELFPASSRFQKYCESRSNSPLTSKEVNTLNQFLATRYSGKAPIFQKDGYFSGHSGLSNTILDTLSISNKKRNLFLFSNLFWDVGLSDRGDLYSSVAEWVLNTIEIIKNSDDIHLYIKPHPAEVYGTPSKKGVQQIIRAHYPNGLKNVTIISPELKINTYDLFPYIDLGVIFNGTLGLEMMLNDIPVIATGMTSHYGLGFNAEPTNKEDYARYLFGDLSHQKPNKADLQLFAYFYFIRTLIPWTLTKRAYADPFDGFSFNTLDDLLPGNDKQLDHLCDCLLTPDEVVPEAWPAAI